MRLYLYLPDTLRIPPTAMAEAEAIPNEERAADHISFNSTLFETLVSRNPSWIDARATKLYHHHAKEKDCRVLAEAEDTRQTVLITRDESFVNRLRDKTNLMLCRPSEYWESLKVPTGARPEKVPHATNPLAEETWWRWD